MSERKKISVVIPTYKRVDELKNAVVSILSQTYGNFEIIVVNDCADEKPVIELLKEFKDKRIKYFRNGRKKGANGARNFGIEQASGDFVAMLDDDDISYGERLQKQLEMFEKDSNAGVLFSFAEVINESGEKIGAEEERLTPEDVRFLLTFKNCIVHSTVMFRKEIIDLVGGYDESLNEAQDYELWCRLSKKTKFVQLREKLGAWRNHESSVTGKRITDQQNTVDGIVKKNLLELTGKEFSLTEIRMLRSVDMKNINELKKSVRILRLILNSLTDGTEIVDLKKDEMRKSFEKRVAFLLYFFFHKKSFVKYPLFFLFLPYYCKKILIMKLFDRLRRF